jgi:hypothetical protein
MTEGEESLCGANLRSVSFPVTANSSFAYGRSRTSSLRSSYPERISVWPFAAIRLPPSQTRKSPHQSVQIPTNISGTTTGKGSKSILTSIEEVEGGNLIPTTFHDSKQLAWAGWSFEGREIPRDRDVHFYADLMRVSKHTSGWLFCVVAHGSRANPCTNAQSERGFSLSARENLRELRPCFDKKVIRATCETQVAQLVEQRTENLPAFELE